VPEAAARLALGTAVHTAATLGAGVLLRLLRPRLDGAWFRVRAGEGRWYRRAGVSGFRRALRASGWERVVTRVRGFDGTRAGLAGLDRHTRLSEASHLLGAAAALAVLGTRGPDLLLAALLHAHPVLLQRSLRTRIAALRTPLNTTAPRSRCERGAGGGAGQTAGVALSIFRW
jgi:hypothetical protein